ncbi:MAG: RNA methyltransferase [Candidatus Binatia bacterium]
MAGTALRVVLVRPKSSGNVGSVARAMKNFGMSDLVLVAPRRFRRFPADAMAVHGRALLDSMRVVDTLADAIADCGWVIGTTCRPGLYRERTRTPREIAPEILSVGSKNRVALVFGPEDTGLANDDVKLCHELVTIPTSPDYTSLNVSQAALLCLYEVHAAARGKGTEPALASSSRLELMYGRLRDALVAIGFLPESNPEHILFGIRRMFGRARLQERDVRIWLGIARQIEWFATGGREVIARKRAEGKRAR